MHHARSVAPAHTRRAFFFLAAILGLSAAGLSAQPGYRPPPDFPKSSQPDQAEGRRVLDEFRGLGIAGDYYLEFQLRVMPRRGAERTYAGRLWGGRSGEGAIARVVLSTPGTERRLLLQDGPRAAAWSWRSGATVEMLDVAALFTPLAQTELTPFDLERPYFYWTDFAYEGVVRIRGRPAYQFLLHPPAEFAAGHPALKGMRIYLDSQFKQPVQSEQIGEGNRVLKTMTVQELKKIGDQWIPKSIDLRDEATGNKTRLLVTGAALRQDFAPGTFAPAALTEDLASPAAAKITVVEP